jgi:hypothetical protein
MGEIALPMIFIARQLPGGGGRAPARAPGGICHA